MSCIKKMFQKNKAEVDNVAATSRQTFATQVLSFYELGPVPTSIADSNLTLIATPNQVHIGEGRATSFELNPYALASQLRFHSEVTVQLKKARGIKNWLHEWLKTLIVGAFVVGFMAMLTVVGVLCTGYFGGGNIKGCRRPDQGIIKWAG